MAAAQPSPVSRRASSHIVTTDAANAEQHDDVVGGLGVARQPPDGQRRRRRRRGWLRRTPSVFLCGWKMLASKRSAGSVSERVRDPGDVPDRDARIAAVGGAAEMIQARCQRPRHQTAATRRRATTSSERAGARGADGVAADAPCRMPVIQPQKPVAAHSRVRRVARHRRASLTAIAVLRRSPRRGCRRRLSAHRRRRARSRLVLAAGHGTAR